MYDVLFLQFYDFYLSLYCCFVYSLCFCLWESFFWCMDCSIRGKLLLWFYFFIVAISESIDYFYLINQIIKIITNMGLTKKAFISRPLLVYRLYIII